MNPIRPPVRHPLSSALQSVLAVMILGTGGGGPVVTPVVVAGDFPALTEGVAIVPFTFTASGGTGPYVFSVSGGAMPAGLVLAADGQVTGTPSAAGAYDVVIRATDSLAAVGDLLRSGDVDPAAPGAFDPSDWFAGGEEGLYYNFNEPDSLFQLSTGATPVTAVWQPIGLTLDLKRGLPVELLADPGFDDPSKWFETVGTGWVVTGGQATFPVATSNAWLNTIVPEMVTGKTYKLSFTVVSGSGLNYAAIVGGAQGPWLSATGRQSMILVAGSVNNYVSIRNANGAVMVVDNITLVEIEPTYALQATAAARPQSAHIGPGIGPELTVNGAFDTDISGWTIAAGGLASVIGGNLTLTNDTSRARLSQFRPTVAGTLYKIVVSNVNMGNSSAGNPRFQFGATQLNLVAGDNVFYHTAVGTNSEFVLFNNAATPGLFFSLDGVSVKEAEIVTSARFDGVDDRLLVSGAVDTPQFTAFALFYNDTTRSSGREALGNYQANAGWAIGQGPAGQARMYTGNGTGFNTDQIANPFVAGELMLVMGAYDGTNTVVRLNGGSRLITPRTFAPSATNDLRVSGAPYDVNVVIQGGVAMALKIDRYLTLAEQDQMVDWVESIWGALP